MKEGRYYGVVWNYIGDTYRATGLLADAKNYEDAKEKMFIHNSIEKLPDGTYKVPKIYYRQRVTDPEVGMEISDGLSQGFELYPESITPRLLFLIEYGLSKSFIREKMENDKE